MSESFEDVRIFAQAIVADCDIPLLDRMKMAHENEIAELQRVYEQKVIDLQTAHEREMEAIRKRLSVLMSKSASLPKPAEITKSDADDGGEVRRITDELRDFVADRMTRGTMYVTLPDVEPKTQLTEEGYKLIAIADRIDEQFERICEQQETVLQSTIEGNVDYDDLYAAAASFAGCDECGEYKQHMYQEFEKRVAVEQERDNLLDLLRDARDEYKMLDQMSAETSANFHAMRDRVWGLEAERDELQKKLEEYERRDTPEAILRDMHLGKVTDSEAIKRIRALDG